MSKESKILLLKNKMDYRKKILCIFLKPLVELKSDDGTKQNIFYI